MRAFLAFVSVVVLAIHGVVFYSQFFAPWQDHQKQYFKEAAARSDSPQVKATLAARQPQIEQILVRNFGTERVDRCTSCHIAVEDPRFAKADQPLKAHPPLPGNHRFENFGCTICHDGRGRAVEKVEAHEGGEDWPWPMLHGALIQANCVQCHTDPAWSGAPVVSEGRRLFFERACYTCHTIAGLSTGSIGPDLTLEGTKRRHDWIRWKIKDPKATNPISTMPKQELTEEQRTALVAFIKAQQGGSISKAPLTQFVAARADRPRWLPLGLIVGEAAHAIEKLEPAARGEALLPKVGCLSCHKLDGRDGRVGPDLAYTSQQRDVPWLMGHFKDPKGLVPGSLMPPYPLPDEIFDSLSRYLLTRKTPEIPADPAQQYQLLCGRCHGEKGAADGLIAGYLDPKPRDLTKASFMRTKPVDRLVASVANGVPGTSMAPWGKVLGEQRAAALVAYVLEAWSKGTKQEILKRPIPAANPVAFSKESAARGEAIFLDRCWGCHGKKADGQGPNAADIHPRPRNLRNGPFVTSLSYARLHESIKYGVQGTAMPAAGFDFALDDRSIGDVINFIQSLHRRPGVEPAKASSTIAEGRKTHE